MRKLLFSPKWHLVSRPLLWVYHLQRDKRRRDAVAVIVGCILAGFSALAVREWLTAFLAGGLLQGLIGTVE
jgi:hypothetical protein